MAQQLDNEVLVEVLSVALTAAGMDVVVFDDAGLEPVYSTLGNDARAAGVISYLQKRLDRADAGGRMMMQRGDSYLTVYPQAVHAGGCALRAFGIRTKRALAVRTGIEYVNADEALAAYDGNVFGVLEGEAALSPLVTEAYERHVPLLFEGEAGSGKGQMALLTYVKGPASNQPLVRINCEIANDKAWRHLLHGLDSPLFQNDLTILFTNIQALDAERVAELVSTARDTALTDRCRVMFAADDMPGGGEAPAAARMSDELRCAVCIAPPLRGRGAVAERVGRYLAFLAEAFETYAPRLSSEAVKALEAYAWPRNYIQLREVSERLFVTAVSGEISSDDVLEVLAQEDMIRSATFQTPAVETDLYVMRPLADTERDIARMVVERLDGSRTRAAEVLGISRTTLWRLLK